MNEINVMCVSDSLVVELTHDALNAARQIAAPVPEATQAKVEEIACLIILTTALNTAISLAHNVSDQEHAAIRKTARAVSVQGVTMLVLPPVDGDPAEGTA